jgi:hypothetical protein
MMIRSGLLMAVMGLIGQVASADGIHYEWIPADVTGYGQVDFERLVSSRLMKSVNDGGESLSAVMANLGDIGDGTIYSLKIDGNIDAVMLWHTKNAAARRRYLGAVDSDKDAISIFYDGQEIHYVPTSLGSLLSKAWNDAVFRGQADAKESPKPAAHGTTGFSIGLGASDDTSTRWFERGPFYVAFFEPDVIVLTGDVPSMAAALDVLRGKKPSLATQDPNGLKMDVPAGAIMVAAGAMASFSTARNSSATQPAETEAVGGAFGLNLAGSLQANARLANIDFGEDEQNLYGDATVLMKDAESAGQFRNLVMGVKALISLTQPDEAALLTPLAIEVEGNDVRLHWSWPTGRLSELIRIVNSPNAHDASSPASTRQ